MPRADATQAECTIYTFKEGLLSPVAHDLAIRVGRFEIDWDEAAPRIDARFDATSLRVIAAMRGGRPDPGALSDRDRAEIERNIARDVLASATFTEIRFTSTTVTGTDARHDLRGTLA